MLRSLASLAFFVTLSSWIAVQHPPAQTDAAVRAAPLILGVNTHFGVKVDGSNYLPDQAAAAIKAAGFTSWRDVASMTRYSRVREGSAHERSTLQRFNAFAGETQAQQSPLLTVMSWPDGSTPGNRMQAFGGTIRQALASYPNAKLIEVWNEWDKNPDPRADRSVAGYADLVRAAVPAIRAAAPDATVLIGAAADDGQDQEFRWTRALLRRPEAALADGLSVHVYNHCSAARRNKAAADMIGRLDRLRADMVSIGKARMSTYVTEFGWPTAGGSCHLDPDEAASSIAQFTILASSRPWIAGIWLYELKDSGNEAVGIENHFGLYDFTMHAKPGVCAATFANRLVRRARVLRTYEGDDVTAVLVRDGGQLKTVAWATRADTPATINVRAGAATPMCSKPQPLPGGSYRLNSTPTVFIGDSLPRAVPTSGTAAR